VSTETVSNVFVIALGCVAIATVVAIATPSLRPRVARRSNAIVALVATGATAGSLYYSEVAEFVPCEYCWYQRIAMYPISVISVLALAFRDRGILRYTLAGSIIGLGISVYHVQLQLFPEQGSSCGLTSPCTAKWVEAFGFVTIPFMAGTAFAIIAAVSTVGLLAGRRSDAHEPQNELVDALDG
jgi:disulfide bond formation protein DsbB